MFLFYRLANLFIIYFEKPFVLVWYSAAVNIHDLLRGMRTQ